MPRKTPERTTRWREAPRDVRPMLAELVDQPAHSRILKRQELVFEPKYDGMRALIELNTTPSTGTASPPSHERADAQEAVRIYSRRGNNKTLQFPELVEPLERLARRLKRPVLLDGEIVAVDEDGVPLGFQHLQGRLHVRRVSSPRASRTASVAFIAFDLLREGDEDLRPRPFTERRKKLGTLFRRPGSDRLRLIESTTGGGEHLRARARRLGWEGLIAKDPRARYFSGRRHPAWQKLKFADTEELVVGGWTDPQQSRSHFGALLLGYYLDAGKTPGKRGRPSGRGLGPLAFAGQVGSGFSQAELERVAKRLAPLAVEQSPFDEFPRSTGRDHWVQPALVVQTKFTEWTLDGLLRNPVYLGIREDKRAAEVRLSDHRPTSPQARMGVPGRTKPRRSTTGAKDKRTPPLRHPEPLASELVGTLDDLEGRKRRGTLVLSDGSRVPVGNLEKVFWPEVGITKGDLVRFYLRMAPYVLPVVADRPLVMKRFPNGVRGKAFYQHRAPDPLPDGLRVAAVREGPEKPDSTVPYLVGGNLQTLLYMAQLAVISQDPWFARLPAIEAADQVALDLDPMPGAPFERVLDVACWLHDELEQLGTPSFPKTSGSEGLHIYIPLPEGTPFEAGMIFCQIVATVVATKHPDVATVERMVKRRPKGTVYIDYLQNIYGKTLAAAYSARATEFAGVSTPLMWKEVHEGVGRGLTPQMFTVRSIFERLDELGDLWSQLRTCEPARLEAAFDYEAP